MLWKSIPYVAMHRRLMRKLKELRMTPPEGIRVQLSEESVLDVVGIVEGPVSRVDTRVPEGKARFPMKRSEIPRSNEIPPVRYDS